MQTTYRDAIARALREEMAARPKSFVLGQDVGAYSIGGVTAGLAEAFGAERVRDCPISESAMVGMAAGAAMNGWIGTIELAYADISAVAFSSLVHSAAKLRYATNGRLACPLILRAPINRFSRHGPMGTETTASWYYNVPDLDIAMPATPHEAYWLLRRAYARPVPTLFLEDRSLGGTSGEIGAEAGGPATLRPGRDMTFIAAGRMALVAREAAEMLARDQPALDCAVLSLGAIKPLDAAAIEEAARATGRVLAIQEEPPFGGYGPAIQSRLCTLPAGVLKRPPRLVARADTFLPYDREENVLPGAAAIMAAARALAA